MAYKKPQTSTNESDSDSAPEETTFIASAAGARGREAQRRHVEIETNRVSKDRRRQRDLRLKEGKKPERKLLSELLKEAQNVTDSTETSGDAVTKVADARASSPPSAERRRKRLIFTAEKDGVTVSVAARTERWLPPAKSSLLAARERFLSRKSVRRR